MKLSYRTKVRVAKITLISLIILITLIFILIPTIHMQLKSNYLFASNILNTLLKKEVNPPVISGTTKSGGAYYLTAKKVINNLINLNLKMPQDITVLYPTLMYTTNNKNLVFSAKSKEATVNTGTYIVYIPGTLSIISNQNHKATLQDVTINLKSDSLESNKVISGSYNNKILHSNGVLINDYGNIIVFRGPVTIKTIQSNSK